MSAASGQGRLTTHVLDTAHGRPAAGLRIDLFRLEGDDERTLLKTLTTNQDGRTDVALLEGTGVTAGTYELVFHAGDYIAAASGSSPFLDEVPVRFRIADPAAHYHVPLLLSPFGYSTYRGS